MDYMNFTSRLWMRDRRDCFIARRGAVLASPTVRGTRPVSLDLTSAAARSALLAIIPAWPSGGMLVL